MGTSLPLRMVAETQVLDSHGIFYQLSHLPNPYVAVSTESQDWKVVELSLSLARLPDKWRQKCDLREHRETECGKGEQTDSGDHVGPGRTCTVEQGRAREPLSHREAARGWFGYF